MPLTWNLEGIENHKEVCWLKDGRMNPVTNALILSTMSIGMNRITPTNVDEFAARYRIIEKLHGPFVMKGDGESYYLTDEDIIAHIGLDGINVAAETRAQWARRIFVNKQTGITNEYARSFRRSMMQKAEA
jgi:hypothetical protein